MTDFRHSSLYPARQGVDCKTEEVLLHYPEQTQFPHTNHFPFYESEDQNTPEKQTLVELRHNEYDRDIVEEVTARPRKPIHLRKPILKNDGVN